MPPIMELTPAEKADELLRRMGVSGCYRGLPYITRAVDLLIEDPERIHYIVKGLYLEVAQELGSTITCVERDIRTVIRAIWANPDHTMLEQVMSHHLVRRPKNGEFLESLTHYIRTTEW